MPPVVVALQLLMLETQSDAPPGTSLSALVHKDAALDSRVPSIYLRYPQVARLTCALYIQLSKVVQLIAQN